jgi:hypothetical protein
MHSGLIVEKAITVLENKPMGVVQSVRRFRDLYTANKSGAR